jgi:hypothetical protein
MNQSKALVTSVHNDTHAGTTRINLRWEGKYDISDFETERFGDILNSDSETEDSGWIEVRFPSTAKPGDSIPLRSGL